MPQPRFLRVAPLALALSLLGACSDGGSATDPALEADDGTNSDAGGSGDGASELPTSDGSTLFDTSRVATLSLEVSEADLAILRSDADEAMGFEDFTYVPARLVYDGVTLDNVGLRVKGNNSRVSAQGDAVPFKLDTNRYVDGQKLDGQSKVNLHNNANQPSKMAEYLSYGAYRELGVAASRTGWVELTLNGDFLGVYTVVEQVGKSLLSRYYDQGSADLYKPEPPGGYLAYSGESFDSYEGVEYEADNDTTHATFLKLVTALDQSAVSEWEDVLDIDTVLDYFAGNVALGNWDTYTSMGHNYYLFEATPGRMVMLPWDMNLSQEATTAVCPADLTNGGAGGPGGPDAAMGGPPSGFGEPPDGEPPPGLGGGMGAQTRTAPLHDKLLSDPLYLSRYFERLQEILEGPASASALGERIDSARAALGERISDEDAEQLRDKVEQRVAALTAALATTTSCTTVGSVP
jgi:spore coat protein H